MKKKLPILLVTVLLLGCITGCSGDGKASNPTPSSAAASSFQSADSDFDFAAVEKPKFWTVDIVEQLPEKPIRIAFLACHNNAWWDNVHRGYEMGAEYLANFNCTVDFIIMGDQVDAQTVNAGIEGAISQGYDGIAVVAFPSGTAAYVDMAADAGIPVVTLYGEDPEQSDKRLAFFGSDNDVFGSVGGETLAELMGEEGGEYIMTVADFTAGSRNNRVDGCREVMAKNPNITEAGIYETKDKAELNYNVVLDAINTNPNLRGVYVAMGGAYGAAKAVEDAGKVGEVFVVGHDLVPENLEHVKKGSLWVCDYNCMQYAVDGLITLYNKLVANQEPPEKRILGGIEGSMIATPENAEEWEETLGFNKK